MANRKAYTACCFLMGSLLYQRGEIFRWCLTLLGLSSTTLFLFLFLSICSLSLNASTVLSATQTSVDWSGEVSALQPCNPSVKWAYWLLCSIVHVSSKWASVVQSSPTFPLVLPSLFQLPSSHQVQVHPGVTSCLVARDNQTAIYVTIISKALSFCPTLIPLSLLPFLLFSFWPAFCPNDAMWSAPAGPRCKHTSYWFKAFSDALAPPPLDLSCGHAVHQSAAVIN